MQLPDDYNLSSGVPKRARAGTAPISIAPDVDRPGDVRAHPQRSKDWDRHIGDLEQLADSPGFRGLRDRIIDLARLRSSDIVLDIGAGTGLLALAAAPQVAGICALDASPAMCRHLEHKFNSLGISNAEVSGNTATDLPLSDGSVDVVLSNYCFHHLSDPEKRQALAEIARVLRPGGRLVFGDMMFRVGVADRRDRAVLARLVKRMLRRGPAGVLRLLKNVARLATGRSEHPCNAEWWRDALLQSGFIDVQVSPLDHEGGIASARRPGEEHKLPVPGAPRRATRPSHVRLVPASASAVPPTCTQPTNGESVQPGLSSVCDQR